MSPKPLPGVTRVTKPCQGRPAPCSLPRNASVRPAGTTGSERWLLRNKIGLALIVSGAVLCFANPGFFFGFIIWVGIILYFQKQGGEAGFDDKDAWDPGRSGEVLGCSGDRQQSLACAMVDPAADHLKLYH